MIVQIKILLLLLNLIIATGVLGYIYSKIKLYQSLYLVYIFRYTALITVLLILVFLAKYLEVNIFQRSFNLETVKYLPYLFSFIYLSGSILVLSMYQVFLSFKNQKIKQLKLLLIFSSILVLVLTILITSYLSIYYRELRWLYSVYDSLGLLFIFLEILILILVLRIPNKFKDSKYLVTGFSIIYLSRYPFLVLAFIFPDLFRLFIVVLILNLAPFLWIKMFVIKYETRKVSMAGIPAIFERITEEYNLSARELDIFKLILQGKNNKQIEKELFISYHTVKNHVYNIFQKTRVHNRYELISLYGTKKDIADRIEKNEK